jgi:hypothetical protein
MAPAAPPRTTSPRSEEAQEGEATDTPQDPRPSDRAPSPADQQALDSASPTAEADAAAADAASDLGSLSSASGSPTSQASATPNAIGDFFGHTGDTVCLYYPAGYIPLNEHVSGPLLQIGANNVVTNQPALIQAVVDPNIVPGAIFVGSGGGTAGLVVNGQTIVVPANFVSSGNNFSSLPPEFLVQENPGVTLAIEQQLLQAGVQGVTFNPSGNVAEVVPGTGNNGGVNDTAALSHVFVDYSYVVNQPVPDGVICVTLPSPGSGGSVGMTKISDNNSARPQNRFFFDFQYFESVPIAQGGVDVRRFTPGFERAFYGPLGLYSSFEFRMPMALTLDSDVLANVPNDVNSAEYGNVAMTLKSLIYDSPTLDLAMGMRVTLPTADDVTLSLSDGTPLIVKENESFHIVPYLAALYDGGGRTFFHAFANIDFDVNGNPVYLNPTGAGLAQAGEISDQTYLFLDGSLGYWIYRDFSRRFAGLATMAELHYNRSLDDAEVVSAGNLQVGDANDNLDLLNATLGVHALFGLTTFTNAMSFPLTRSDRLFDWVYRFFVNRAY